MRKFILLLICALLQLVSHIFAQSREESNDRKYILVIHGGAGVISRTNMSQEKDSLYRAKLFEVLTIGDSILKNHGSAIDAVEQLIIILEDSPLFNAGKGAVFNYNGKNELDASIMDGSTGKAGAVAGVTNIKNPISAARAVMEKSNHVMMAGKGAEQFASEQGLTIVDQSYFFTQERWDQYIIKKKKDSLNDIKGTVGVVALDMNGNLAAGTSTGGMTNKKYGRIGDSPIIGAGTYANNSTCAVSCTGWGEYFIRNVVAYDVSAMMEYTGISLDSACRNIIQEKLKDQGADGGLIAVDKKGNFSMQFNTDGMFRGYVTSGGIKKVFIYKEE